MGTGRTAIVHGGNAIVRKHNKHFGGGIIVRGKFLAGPDVSVDPVIDPLNRPDDALLMFTKMNFVIFADKVDCLPTRRAHACNEVVD